MSTRVIDIGDRVACTALLATFAVASYLLISYLLAMPSPR
jgi:hypothetical protein